MTKQCFKRLLSSTRDWSACASNGAVSSVTDNHLTAVAGLRKWQLGISLQVNYEEKMYAAGKFPGGFMET